jgi:hypothetical protein
MIKKTPRRQDSKALDESAIMFPKPKRKPRTTAKKGINTPSKEFRLLVMARSNFTCERCGKKLGEGEHVSVHHRTPRGMGGSHDQSLNLMSNLMALCGSGTTGCHGWIESHRQKSMENGWLVLRGVDASTVPVVVRGIPVYLNNEGTYDRI